MERKSSTFCAATFQETQPVEPPSVSPAYAEPQTAAAEDPLAAERRRREYESLFASNVVLSRRPDAERPDAGRAGRSSDAPGMVTAARDNPSLDDIADAVVRATARVAGSSPSQPNANVGAPDADGAAPVNCLVTNPVYSHSGQHVLIPAGARILGETRPVQALGETRLAVAFHRLVMPDGRTHRLDQFVGMNQIGDSGLRDQVNRHYGSTFGAAGAVGLISGLAQWLGTAGFAGGSGDRTVIIAGGADATSQASLQVMNRFLNRLPAVTIREGHRVKIYLTSDLELPAYEGPGPGTF